MKKTIDHIFLLIIAILFVACSTQPHSETEEAPSPLNLLKTGNLRFVHGHSIHPNENIHRIHELKHGQDPFAVVVSCSDSRIPPELIFDRGLGDLFIIRTAGNVIGDFELGSIEYAIQHLDCKLIVVLGHEKCGAVGAFINSGKEHHLDHLQKIIDYIANEEEEMALKDSIKKNPDLAVRANIQHAVKLIRESEPVIKPLTATSSVKVIGAYYDMDTGRVTFDN